jgi:hypothetical protein
MKISALCNSCTIHPALRDQISFAYMQISLFVLPSQAMQRPLLKMRPESAMAS